MMYQVLLWGSATVVCLLVVAFAVAFWAGQALGNRKQPRLFEDRDL